MHASIQCAPVCLVTHVAGAECGYGVISGTSVAILH
jgi:hypothetical protein